MLIVLFFLINLNFSFAAKEKSCDIKIKKLNLCMTAKFVDGISRKADSKFNLSFKNLKTNTQVKLTKAPQPKLWMVMKNGHEHGSEVVTAKINTDGSYLIENVWFLMQGEWKVFVDVTQAKLTEKTMFNVCVKRKKSESYPGKCK
jgi:hypothetical protein